MASAKAASEPSMEDILASIRQIIADEDSPESEAEKVNDQAAIDDAFDNIDVGDDAGEEMSTDDVDALFDSPVGAPEEENDQAAIDAAFDNIDVGDDDGEEMSTDDVDALFDSATDDDDDDDVLTLSADQTIDQDSEDDISFDMDEAVTPEPAQPAAPPAPKTEAPASTEARLLSNDAAGSVQASFGALNSAMTLSSANTIEDLMKSMMRPMLKQWLDENLPETVERLVQAEIERMRNQ